MPLRVGGLEKSSCVRFSDTSHSGGEVASAAARRKSHNVGVEFLRNEATPANAALLLVSTNFFSFLIDDDIYPTQPLGTAPRFGDGRRWLYWQRPDLEVERSRLPKCCDRGSSEGIGAAAQSRAAGIFRIHSSRFAALEALFRIIRQARLRVSSRRMLLDYRNGRRISSPQQLRVLARSGGMGAFIRHPIRLRLFRRDIR